MKLSPTKLETVPPAAETSFSTRRRQFSTVALVPFASYYGKTNALALFDFLGGILRFIPLGFLLQGYGRAHRASRKWSAVLICLLTGILLEGMQLFVAGRYADSSDIIAAGCGGYAGWWLWRWWVNRS